MNNIMFRRLKQIHAERKAIMQAAEAGAKLAWEQQDLLDWLAMEHSELVGRLVFYSY